MESFLCGDIVISCGMYIVCDPRSWMFIFVSISGLRWCGRYGVIPSWMDCDIVLFLCSDIVKSCGMYIVCDPRSWMFL